VLCRHGNPGIIYAVFREKVDIFHEWRGFSPAVFALTKKFFVENAQNCTCMNFCPAAILWLPNSGGAPCREK
jgi:hypothetical protein